ncbi:MAG TPA: glycosyltransferase family 4 protein [Vicinamibacterales bacterium]|jgi:glycosyltransferase involved in cell wall biosynthesis|nr:glycosyltransferase family 4 protein [Vicinamibacterales bacterium]
MRFCMVSTFYPPYHFGGDAIFVQRLAGALARRGHAVDVIHDRDAYYLAHRGEPESLAAAQPNVRVHGLKSRFGALSPLLTQQTARPWLKPELRRRLESGAYDVVHFHNPSLIGSTTFAFGHSVKLYTLHEHWLICPMHVLWKFGREACDRPECVRCCLQGRRPPQLWRYTNRLAIDLAHIDRFLSPSRFTLDRHQRAGLRLPATVLPHFVPDPIDLPAGGTPSRPYFLYAGRLVKLKGVDALVRAFRRYRDADLLIAGDGEEGDRLRQEAADLPHVRFLGRVSPDDLGRLYRDAIAVVMPSAGYEVFGLVLIEAFARRTPVIARNLGALPEVVAESEGGLLFDRDDQLVECLEALQSSAARRDAMGEAGYRAYRERWTEQAHIDAYLAIVDEAIRRRG